ncbi:TPA: hypothetical protein DCX16_01105 [bacterium]|nr:hypothetical protein [bacterium]
MKLFYMYFGKHFAFIFFISLLFFLFLTTTEKIVSVISLVIKNKVPIFLGIKAILFLIPSCLGFVIPMAFLMSTIIEIGKFSSSRALIAMETCGISMGMLIISFIFLGLLISSVAFFINEKLSPIASFKQFLLCEEISSEKIELLEEKTFTKIDEREIYLEKKYKEYLKGIYITEEDGKRVIFAKEGEIKKEDDVSLLLLKKGSIHEIDEKNPKKHRILNFKSLSLPIEPKKQEIERKKLSHFTLSELKNKKDKSNPSIMTEYQKRLAISFAPFFLSLIAIPIGFIIKRNEMLFSLSFSTIIILSYYIMFLGLEALSRKGINPTILWLPNIISCLIGSTMLKRHLR